MRVLLVVNGVFELAIGLVMVMLPRVLVPHGILDVSILIRILGFASIGLAAMSFSMVNVDYGFGFESALLGFTVFHFGMALGTCLGLTQRVVPLAAVVAHGVLAALFAASFVYLTQVHKRRQEAVSEPVVWNGPLK